MTFRARHLLGIEHLAPDEIRTVLDLSERYVDLNRRTVKSSDALAGLTVGVYQHSAVGRDVLVRAV